VFYTNDSLKRFGPGHNSFVLAEDGVTHLMLYHARDYKDIQGHPLQDGNRHTRVRPLYWTAQGQLDFAQDKPD
jgi:GH43 family beta-xylosidase